MKIAFISLMGGQPWGGSEVLWSKTAELALEQGHKVFVSVYRFPEIPIPIAKLKEKGAFIHFRERYNPNQSIFKKLNNYLKKSGVYRKLWDFKPDHILISQGNNFDLVVHHYRLFEEIKQNNIPYSIICHSHSQYGFIPGKNIYPRGKEVFLKAKNIFFVSNRQKGLTERNLCTELNNAKITWNPLNIKTKKYLTWPDNRIVQFAMVAGLTSGKGHDTLFEILSHEKWKTRDWHLNIYGDGDGKMYLNDLVKWYNINDKITFHGYVNDIKTVWKKNHILLIPSAGEGLPMSLCEAMICGRPAVATDVGGHSEVISEGETGFIADASTASSFANALDKAWFNIEKWEEMGKKASSFAFKKINLKPHESLLSGHILS
jgi:L-malate glycosyltransferase